MNDKSDPVIWACIGVVVGLLALLVWVATR